jgi:hypothetical protein
MEKVGPVSAAHQRSWTKKSCSGLTVVQDLGSGNEGGTSPTCRLRLSDWLYLAGKRADWTTTRVMPMNVGIPCSRLDDAVPEYFKDQSNDISA